MGCLCPHAAGTHTKGRETAEYGTRKNTLAHIKSNQIIIVTDKQIKINQMKKLIIIIIIGIFMQSCARYYTPFQAASTGGKKCSKWNNIR